MDGGTVGAKTAVTFMLPLIRTTQVVAETGEQFDDQPANR